MDKDNEIQTNTQTSYSHLLITMLFSLFLLMEADEMLILWVYLTQWDPCQRYSFMLPLEKRPNLCQNDFFLPDPKGPELHCLSEY